jgi:hypothetical protein
MVKINIQKITKRVERIFNLVMVAKQGWNIMNNSDTIVANTLKARYFPHSFRSLCSLPPIIEDDRVVWSYDRRGVYMVRSSYHMWCKLIKGKFRFTSKWIGIDISYMGPSNLDLSKNWSNLDQDKCVHWFSSWNKTVCHSQICDFI